MKPTHRLLPWALAFLLINLAVKHDGGVNAASRWLAMRSMCEQGTFTIDHRIEGTIDWARTPDGHYYSNKAPGPMLLGLPAFAIIDQIPRLWDGRRDEHGLRPPPSTFTKTITCLLVQELPMLLLTALV